MQTITYPEIKTKINRLLYFSYLQSNGFRDEDVEALEDINVNQPISELKSQTAQAVLSQLSNKIPNVEIIEDEEIPEHLIVFAMPDINEKLTEAEDIMSAESRQDVRMFQQLEENNHSFSRFKSYYDYLKNDCFNADNFSQFDVSLSSLIKKDDNYYFVLSIYPMTSYINSQRRITTNASSTTESFGIIVGNLSNFYRYRDEGITAVNDYRQELKVKLAKELEHRKEEYAQRVQEAIYYQEGNQWYARPLTYENLSYESMNVHVMSEDGSNHEGWKILPAFREISNVEGYTFEGWGRITDYNAEHPRSMEGQMPVVVQDYIHTELKIEDWMEFLPDAPNGQTYAEVSRNVVEAAPESTETVQLALDEFVDMPYEPEAEPEAVETELMDFAVYYNHNGVPFERFIVVDDGEHHYYATIQEVKDAHPDTLDETINLIRTDLEGDKQYTHHVYVGDNKMGYPSLSEVMAFDYKNPTEVINFPLLRR